MERALDDRDAELKRADRKIAEVQEELRNVRDELATVANNRDGFEQIVQDQAVQIALYSNKFKPSEIDLMLDIRAGKVITHKLPATYAEAIGEAAFMIDEARIRCGRQPLEVVDHAGKGLTPYKPPGDEGADKAVGWGTLKVERNPDNSDRIAASVEVGRNPFHTAAVARRAEADLAQANEPYRDSEPGEHQEVLDALKDC